MRPCVRPSDATVPRFNWPAEPARTVGRTDKQIFYGRTGSPAREHRFGLWGLSVFTQHSDAKPLGPVRCHTTQRRFYHWNPFTQHGPVLISGCGFTQHDRVLISRSFLIWHGRFALCTSGIPFHTSWQGRGGRAGQGAGQGPSVRLSVLQGRAGRAGAK